MKQSAFALLIAAAAAAAIGQTAPKPATHAASTTHHTATSALGVKLPPGVPPGRGILRTAFSLKYQDLKIGTGAEAEPNKLYKVQYTGYRAADGVKFDSSYDHPGAPVMDKDGKPEKDADGKIKLGPPQPMTFPQGMGRLIPGFDQGFAGMKIGGKRRLFIPWQLAYGMRDIPARGTEHPGIPPKSDLIFDVELVDVTDMPAPPMRPGMGGRPMPPHPGAQPLPSRPPTPGAAPGTPGAAPATPVPVTPLPATAPAPATPPTQTTPQPH
jgi:peptidylprolyl isomerase